MIDKYTQLILNVKNYCNNLQYCEVDSCPLGDLCAVCSDVPPYNLCEHTDEDFLALIKRCDI